MIPDTQNAKTMHKEITIYSDGSALGNPGPGGYGTILMSGVHKKELSQGYRLTTNNRMELMGAIVGLESIRESGHRVTIYSDSKYLVDAINQQWIVNWERTNYKGKKNRDLWERFMLAFRRHSVTMCWVKGHSTNRYNNRCDELAVCAAKARSSHLEDTGYVG